MRLDEISTKTFKAGLIPYYVRNNQLFVMLVTSTNPNFGGPYPSIAKGSGEKGEHPKQTAIREVQEETGLTVQAYSKIFHLSSVKMGEKTTSSGLSYYLHVYAAELIKPVKLTPTFEAIGKYYPIETALKVIRKSHRPILQKLTSLNLL